MTTAVAALVVSILSAVISLAGFVWNVWSKFVYPRAKVRVSLSVTMLIGSLEGDEVHAISLRAVNFGPTEITLKLATSITRWHWKKRQHGALMPWTNFPQMPAVANGPYGGGLPKKLAVGEEFSVYFVLNHKIFASDEFDRFGFGDVFGRTHYAPRKDTRAVRAQATAAIQQYGPPG